MISTENFYKNLLKNNITFFTGIPDSLLSDICAKISDENSEKTHVITANEGSAIAIASGYHLSTGNIPLVYMQNSGLGNAINPLTSLASPEVYGIPMLIMVGWRGEPGIKDEPQHIKKGSITLPLLDVMKIPYFIIPQDDEEAEKLIAEAKLVAIELNTPVALIVRKNLFSGYKLKDIKPNISELRREEAIETILSKTNQDNSLYFGNTGMIGRELYETRKRIKGRSGTDFLNVGSMGHTSQIALGVSLNTKKQVYCIDGDGAAIMHLGGLTTIGQIAGENFIHIILNNSAHDSVGGQPTIADKIDFNLLSKALGYTSFFKTKNSKELAEILESDIKGPVLIEVLVKKGNRVDIGRPSESPSQNKLSFMKNLGY